jgi:hypothetical protein
MGFPFVADPAGGYGHGKPAGHGGNAVIRVTSTGAGRTVQNTLAQAAQCRIGGAWSDAVAAGGRRQAAGGRRQAAPQSARRAKSRCSAASGRRCPASAADVAYGARCRGSCWQGDVRVGFRRTWRRMWDVWLAQQTSAYLALDGVLVRAAGLGCRHTWRWMHDVRFCVADIGAPGCVTTSRGLVALAERRRCGFQVGEFFACQFREIVPIGRG